MGRIRLACLPAPTRQHLHGFIRNNIQPGSEICTDGFPAYRGLEPLGYGHQVVVLVAAGKEAATTLLPHVHRVASLLKRWLLGTHHGSIGPTQLRYYLDEFTFRFNRRKASTPGTLFHALLQQAVREEPAPYTKLISIRQELQ